MQKMPYGGTISFMYKLALKRVKYFMELGIIDLSIEHLSENSMKHQVAPKYAAKCIETADKPASELPWKYSL